MTIGERDPGCGEPCGRRLKGGAGRGRGLLPSGSLQHRERARAPRRRRFGRALQAGIPWIAAGPRRDVDRDQPSVFERRGEHAGAALAEVIVAAAAVDPADTRLEADAAAEARGPQDRADDLRPERRRHHAAGNGGGGAAARPTRGALPVPWIAGAARFGGGELGGHHFPEDHRARLAQSRNAGGVATGAAADKQRRALPGRHVGGLDDVLDAERHPVDRRQGPAGAPARRRAVRSRARGGDIVADKGSNAGFERLQTSKAAFEKFARRVEASREIRRGGKE